MPVHKTKGGYKYGETGKTYKDKKSAIKQAIAIAYSKAERQGREPSRKEIENEISGKSENIDKKASGYIMKNKALELALFKQASARMNAYGLLIKVAAFGDEKEGYGKRKQVGAGSYRAQREAILNRFGYEQANRGKSKFGIRGNPDWYDYVNIFSPKKLSKAWNSLGDRLFDRSVSKAEGDAYRKETAKAIAKDFAAGNSSVQKILEEELMRRSEHNLNTFRRTGRLRGNFYTEPNQTWLDEVEDRYTSRGAQTRARLRRMGLGDNLPEDDDAKYTRRLNDNAYSPSLQAFLDVYRAMNADDRKRFDEVSAGV